MANLRTIQFLRSSKVYNSLDAAKAALSGKAETLLDGSPIVGRYTSGATELSVIGIVHKNATATGVTFFESANDIANRLAQLQAELDAAEAAVGLASGGTKQEIGVAGDIIYDKASVELEIKALNDYILTSDFGPKGGSSSSVIDFIQQSEGRISATTKNVGELTLSGYTKGSDSGSVAATDSINAAMSKLEKQVDAEVAARTAKFLATSAASVANDNKVITDVTQADGKITATAANITSVKLDGYAEAAAVADVASTDTLGQALGKLQKTIHEMDKDADAVAGQVVTTVSEADGVVSETKANVKDLQLGGYAKTTETGPISGTDTINTALSKIENQIVANSITNEDGSITVTPGNGSTDIKVHIKDGEKVIKLDADDGIYTDLDLVKITNGLPAEVKERYQLLASDDTQIGANIDIPKDSHIVSITYITDSGDTHYQNLKYEYIDVSGNTQTTYVDMSELVLEAEFESGVTATDGVVHGVVDAASEKDESNVAFLTVGEDGFKVSGIKDAIDTKINKLDADLSGNTTHVTVGVKEEDGKIIAVTVAEDDIASAQGLADEITARTAADTELSNRLGTGVTTANTATAQLIALSGDSNSVSGDTSVEGAKRYADAILANSVADLDADKSGSTIHVTVGVKEEDGKITTVTVAEDNIANADDLATLSGKTFTVATSSNGSITTAVTAAADGTKSVDLITDTDKIKLSGFTASASTSDIAPANGDTINEALAKIYATAKHHHLASGNGGIVTSSTVDGTTVTLTLDSTTESNATDAKYTNGKGNVLQIKDGGLYLDAAWDAGTFE